MSHFALSHCLILCWCLWLVRLHVISALCFLYAESAVFYFLIFRAIIADVDDYLSFFVSVNVCTSVSQALWKRPPRRSTRFRWTQICGLGLTSGKWFKGRSRPQWPLFQKKSSMSESLLLYDSLLWCSDCCYWCFVYWPCFYCGFWLSLCKIERWAVQLGVWAAGVEGRHKESHVSLEERCFILPHTGRKMFSQVEL